MISVRLDETLVEAIDLERRRAGKSRASVIQEALAAWLERARYEEAVRHEHDAYDRQPVTDAELAPVLGAQTWPE
jgi:Arc/MetJ-type ribon-helix-helix transcriptional regulator